MNIYRSAAGAAALFSGIFALQAGAPLPALLAMGAALLIVVDGFVSKNSGEE